MLVSTGTTGFTAFLEALAEIHGIVHAGIKITGVDERGSVRSIRSQYVKVTMITPDVPQLKRAKSLQIKDMVDRAFGGANVVVDVASVDEIAVVDIERRLASAAGAHKPGRYDFEGVDDDLQVASPIASPRKREESQAVPKGDVAETNVTAASEEKKSPNDAGPAADAVATAEEVPAKMDTKPAASDVPAEDKVIEEEKKEVEAKDVEAKAECAAPVVESPPIARDEGPLTIEDAWLRVHDEKHINNYLIITFDGKNVNSAEIVATGQGDLEAFKRLFVDDKPIFAGFRLRAIDDRGSVISVRPKIIFVSMIGKGVRPVVRAQAGAVKQHFEKLFSGHHVPMFIDDASELTESDIVQRLRASGGAHQPNRYDFSGKKGQEM